MKNTLRKIAKEKRTSLFSKNLNIKIKENLVNSNLYKNANNILCYHSFGCEISTLDFFDDNSKNWFLPKIVDNDLIICPFEKDNFTLNKYNIKEPNSQPIKDLSIIDLMIIPAICADKKGYRIGYGKGYYDRFLKTLTHNPTKVILTYSQLVYETVHPSTFDEKCDYIVTENSIIESC